MRGGVIVLLCGLTTLPAIAEAAPQQLFGKSVVISISEMRTSRPVGGGPASDSSARTQFNVYISSAGRTFVRSDRTLTTRRGTESKAIDTGPGGGAIGVAVASNVQFSGNSMIVNMQMVSGGRRITATFDGAYSSCSATVINGREGDKAMVIKNRYTGLNREVLSIQSSVNGCSVRDGNVFGQ